PALRALAEIGARLGEDARQEVIGQGVRADVVTVHERAPIRYAGTDMALAVPSGDARAMQAAFEAAHSARFGFIDQTKQIVVEAVSVEAVGGGAHFSDARLVTTTMPLPAPACMTRFYSAGAWHDATVFTRAHLA